MTEYIVKNLDKNLEQEVRIYRIDKNSTLVPVQNFHILNDLTMNVSIRLKPDYTIECTGAFNSVGVIESVITAGTTLTTTEGDVTAINDEEELISALENNFGLDAVILQDYVPPIQDDHMTFTVHVSDTATPLTLGLTSEDMMDFSASIDWGDGKVETLISADGEFITEHTYDLASKNYTVKIINEKPLSSAYIAGEITEVTNWGKNICRNFLLESAVLTTVPNYLPEYVTSTYSMFAYCSIFNQDISGWDMSRVSDFSYMFSDATAFNQPIGNWNTSNVTNIYGTFRNTNFNQPLNNWDTSKVTVMSYVFTGAVNFNQPLNTWDTSNVTSMSNMFNGATSFNQSLSNWDVSSVTNMSSMFYSATAFNGDISNWVTKMVGNMNFMFESATKFTGDLSQWCVPLIASLPSYFATGATLFTSDKFPVWGTCPRGENQV